MIISPRLADIPTASHGFFTRQGGVSTGIYAGLNCGFGSDDRPEAVAENRRRVAGELGVQHLLTVHQIHSADAVTVTEPWTPETAPRADGMATNLPDIALGVLAADCAPILLADPEAHVIGAAHAGWKGALLGIAGSVVAAMEGLGAARSRIVAAVGPCLAREAFEIGPDFEDRLLAEDAAYAAFLERRPDWAKPHFDLSGFVTRRLHDAGLRHVETLEVDTYTNEDRFFSYRRACHRGEADYGRHISAIALNGGEKST